MSVRNRDEGMDSGDNGGQNGKNSMSNDVYYKSAVHGLCRGCLSLTITGSDYLFILKLPLSYNIILVCFRCTI